jgi:hypothetical protein
MRAAAQLQRWRDKHVSAGAAPVTWPQFAAITPPPTAEAS